ncbi:uncharacterized protein ACLA_089450 [Aspergillus clavatus NRRL 1]|uniref:GPI-anchored cell wall organization protein Ecm33 n=1 Tax=Aspergillus clavatus (strain ATCC 1007 / CBS 513.65 / DSM 816 / NCTC 3887 / NRRL 1 / QM 1276 / 107) TaxID=344612 RepID=A1CEF4_ASPCL|nr:uncharacterized protein ACLA_089450 [Aspergillus clavatus NRRL 1]EAW11253.1 conserved hypothetical protein [Aspergillus clavatus NRRL 1]
MSDFRRWLAVGLIAAIFPSFASAITCLISSPESDSEQPFFRPYPVESADDLNRFATDNCTVIYGNIEISSDFNGAFAIPNVEIIYGNITLRDSSGLSSVNLTSIELPNALAVEGIELPDIPALKNISAPKAILARSIKFAQQSSISPNVDFRSLIRAENISLTGNYSSLHFDALQKVNNSLSVCSVRDCGPADKFELAISFPALISAAYIRVGGLINSLSLPALETINATKPDYAGPLGLDVHNYGRPLALDFPKLRSVSNTLDLQGSISSLSLDSLAATDADILIDTDSSLDLNFRSLESANTIQLNGSITSAEFPVLQHVQRVTINADSSIDCRPLKQALQRAAPNSDSICNRKSVFEPKGLSPGAKAGIAVGCSIAALAFIAASVWIWRKMDRPKARRTLPWRASPSLRERRRESVDEPPPPYSVHPPV